MSQLTHLDRLEAESIFILRETVAEAAKPVMLYSMGKDSAVMLHLARKAFFPGPLPFPLLHVDTTGTCMRSGTRSRPIRRSS
jgi:sulfate adenylyltransferase subunit 2